MVELDDVLLGRIAKDEFAHVPEHKHLDLLLVCCSFYFILFGWLFARRLLGGDVWIGKSTREVLWKGEKDRIQEEIRVCFDVGSKNVLPHARCAGKREGNDGGGVGNSMDTREAAG